MNKLEYFANLILSHIPADEGFTVDPITALPVVADAWSVSIPGYETKFDRKTTRAKIISDIREKNEMIFNSKEKLLFGGWPQYGHFFFDLSKLIASKAKALAFAEESEQDAIFHLSTGEVLYLKPPKRRAA